MSQIRQRAVKSVITKTKTPAEVAAFAVNPYVGCPHKCLCCYACFMKRFTGHTEPQGEFIDIKNAPPLKNPQKYAGSKIFVGTVTDGYNPFEAEYKRTKQFLEQFIGVEAEITVATKSKLVLRDVDLLKRLHDVTVSVSINRIDDAFRTDMDKASSIPERIETLRVLHENGIRTIGFISPIFPGITVVEDIVEATNSLCNVYWLENFNLRGGYKKDILEYIQAKYPQLIRLYRQIYSRGDKSYWYELGRKLDTYAKSRNVNMANYFFHELVRQQ